MIVSFFKCIKKLLSIKSFTLTVCVEKSLQRLFLILSVIARFDESG